MQSDACNDYQFSKEFVTDPMNEGSNNYIGLKYLLAFICVQLHAYNALFIFLLIWRLHCYG